MLFRSLFAGQLSKQLIKAGLDITEKNVAAEIAKVKLSYPKDIDEARRTAKDWLKEVSPNSARANRNGTVDEVLAKEITDSLNVLKKSGIPSAISAKTREVLRVLNMSADEAIKNRFRVGVDTSALKISGLLPGTRPVGGRPGVKFGLSTQEVEDVGRGIPKRDISAEREIKVPTDRGITQKTKLSPKIINKELKLPPYSSEFITRKARESTLLKEKIRRIQKQAISESKKEIQIQRLKNEFETKFGAIQRKSELKILRTGIEQRAKGITKGLREGHVFTKKEIKTVQNELINTLDKSNLDLNDKAKFIKAIKNVQTPKQLEKVLDRKSTRLNSSHIPLSRMPSSA